MIGRRLRKYSSPPDGAASAELGLGLENGIEGMLAALALALAPPADLGVKLLSQSDSISVSSWMSDSYSWICIRSCVRALCSSLHRGARRLSSPAMSQRLKMRCGR